MSEVKPLRIRQSEYDGDVFYLVSGESPDVVFFNSERKDNAQRLADCYNALAGIPNPAGFVKSHADLLEALEDALQYLQHHLPEEMLAPHRAAIAKAKGKQ